MKTLVLLFVALFSTTGPFAFSGDHDSLTFDGSAEQIKEVKYFDDCILKVKHVKGKVHGTKYVMKSIGGDCLTKEVFEAGTQEALLKHEDVLVGGTELRTEADSYLYVDLPDGSTIIMKPYTILKIEDDWCGKNFFLRGGSIWLRIKKALGAGEFQISEGRAVHGVRGTEFEIESSETETILRVYEGTVETEQKGTGGTKEMSDLGKEMEQLTKDLQEGKITVEEFSKKVEELKKGSQTGSSDNLKKLVNAGYMLTITDTALMEDPVPFSGSTGWWENIMWDN